MKTTKLMLVTCLAMLAGLAGNAFGHYDVPLRDATGAIITTDAEGVGAAYSSKMTCGTCHNYSNIEQHSYHALLGSNELKGYNPFNPDSTDKYKSGVATKGKSWVQSPGHVGKW